MIQYFCGLAAQDKRINSFGYGPIYDISSGPFFSLSGEPNYRLTTKSPTYPLMWVEPDDSTLRMDSLVLNHNIHIIDLVNKDNSNRIDVLSDSLLSAQEIKAFIQKDFFYDIFPSDESTLTPLFEKYDDEVAGYKMSLSLQIDWLADVCNIPGLYPSGATFAAGPGYYSVALNGYLPLGGGELTGALTGTTATFSSLLATSLSGNNIYLSGVSLTNLFLGINAAISSATTAVQGGLNTYTGGTILMPTVNVSAATLSYLSASTISGGTVTLTDLPSPSNPVSGNIILHSFNQQGFSIPHIKDSIGNDIEITRDSITVFRNNTGSAITKGQVVYLTGATGTVPTVGLAIANALNSLPAIGIAYNTTNNNSFGQMMVVGNLENINLSTFNNGDLLYVSPTIAGGLTSTKPTYPNYAQSIGSVLNNGVGNGILQVFIRVVEGIQNGQNANLNSLSATTFYSGATNLYQIFATTGNTTLASTKVGFGNAFNQLSGGNLTWNDSTLELNLGGSNSNLIVGTNGGVKLDANNRIALNNGGSGLSDIFANNQARLISLGGSLTYILAAGQAGAYHNASYNVNDNLFSSYIDLVSGENRFLINHNGVNGQNRLGISINVPQEKLHISGGTMRINTANATEGAGKLAVSDVNGSISFSSTTALGLAASSSTTLTSTQVGFGNASNALTGTTNLIFSNTNKRLNLGGTGVYDALGSINIVDGGATLGYTQLNTNTAGYTGFIFGENASTSYLQLFRGNSTNPSTANGISVADVAFFTNGSTYNQPMYFGASVIYNAVAQTNSNYATRLDSAGFRIDALSAITTSNTVPFYVYGNGIVNGSLSATTISGDTIAIVKRSYNVLAPVSVNSSYTINWATKNVFDLTLTAATTFSFSNIVPGQTTVIAVRQPVGATGYNYSFSGSSVSWPAGTTPTPTTTTGKTDIYTFISLSGSSVYGSAVLNF